MAKTKRAILFAKMTQGFVQFHIVAGVCNLKPCFIKRGQGIGPEIFHFTIRTDQHAGAQAFHPWQTDNCASQSLINLFMFVAQDGADSR